MIARRDFMKDPVLGDYSYFQPDGLDVTMVELHVNMANAVRARMIAHSDQSLDTLYNEMWTLPEVLTYMAGTSETIGRQAVRAAFIRAVRQYLDRKAFFEHQEEVKKQRKEK